jgi:uncharacterized membrane protein YfcA
LFEGCFVASYYAAALHSFSRPFKIVYPTRQEKRAALWPDYVKAHWTKITLAAALGMLFGFIAGVVSSRAGALFTPVVYAAASAPMPSMLVTKPARAASNQSAQDELIRLRAQNEQLASMLAELKKNAPPSHARRAIAHRRRRTHAHA